MRIFLCGGGCGKQTIEANKKLNEIIAHNKPLLYIPLAMKSEKYDSCYEWITGELSNVEVTRIDMVRSKEELSEKNLDEYGAIFIGGGNTFKLLSDLKTSGSFGKINNYINNNGIVFGGSAGAIIFGKDLDACKLDDSNDIGLIDTNGFNVLNDISILCHYTNRERKKDEQSTEYLMNNSRGRTFLALPEEDTIFINGNDIEVIGNKPYYKFKNGFKKEILPNQILIRKIDLIEFDELKRLFPGNDESWLKYRETRLKQFNNNEIEVYVIEYNGNFIGEIIINYISHELQSETIPGSRVYLEAFRLEKKYQGKGLGQSLVTYVITDLEKKGYTEFTIGVEDDNAIAKHIYFKYGFTEAIDKGNGNEFDPCKYTLYLKDIKREKHLKK